MLVNVSGYGFEWGSFVWLGSGMWSMLWALWLMPIAIGPGLARGREGRAVRAHRVRGRPHVRVALHHRLSRAARLRRVRARAPAAGRCKRLGRGALVGLGGLLIFAFVFVPDARRPQLRRTSTRSRSARSGSTRTARARSSRWLFRGEVFDYGRCPDREPAASRSGASCASWRSRSDETARVVLGLMVLSLLLYSGRRVVGPVIDHLPGGVRPPPAPLHHRCALRGHAARRHRRGVGVPAADRRARVASRTPRPRRRRGRDRCRARASRCCVPVLVNRRAATRDANAYVHRRAGRRRQHVRRRTSPR